MSDEELTPLQARMAAAKAAQTFKPDTEEETPAPAPPDKKAKPKKAAKKQGKTKRAEPMQATATAAETTPTANEAARRAAGLETGPSLSRAEYMALRRQTMATISVEVHPDDKAELIKAATENGRTLRAEVLDRLGIDE